jgi:hypothetical protein
VLGHGAAEELQGAAGQVLVVLGYFEEQFGDKKLVWKRLVLGQIKKRG